MVLWHITLRHDVRQPVFAPNWKLYFHILTHFNGRSAENSVVAVADLDTEAVMSIFKCDRW